MDGTSVNVAAVDIGSNSVRLLIRDAGGDVLERVAAVTGLARGVDERGQLSDAAIEATLDVIGGFRALIDHHGVRRMHAVATSAARDAENGPAAMASVADILGAMPEIISGDREAALSFAGATSGAGLGGTQVVVDIGGGSTEVISGAERIQWASSYDVGSVRLSDRVMSTRPAPAHELAAATAETDRILSTPSIEARTDRIIGVAGTFTSLAAMHLGLAAYDPDAVHRTTMSRDDVDRLLDHLATLDVDQTARIPSLQPGRAPVILAGTLIATRVMDIVGANAVLVSESDLLDGVAAELVSD